MRRARWTTVAWVALLAVAVPFVSGCASTDAPSGPGLLPRATAAGIAPDLLFTTDVSGYTLAPQSVGAVGDDGMSATWFDQSTGAMISIRTQRGEPTQESCAGSPMFDVPGARVECTQEGGLWHRTGGGVEEYIAVRDGASILVLGSSQTPPADLRAAAEAVHTPSDGELALLVSDLPATPPPVVERGDLPENGDGAPIQPTGPGG